MDPGSDRELGLMMQLPGHTKLFIKFQTSGKHKYESQMSCFLGKNREEYIYVFKVEETSNKKKAKIMK
jgi:hypothetical protein